ncbi:MAG: RodZ domain-containing protein [Candidatus Omnitrophota bacterium]
MIKEVCSKLKEKRANLGYSLEETVEKTKLHPSVIRDIESGDLSNINSAYLKGFMRIYASFLEIDMGRALEEIESVPSPQIKNKKKIVKKNLNPVSELQAQKLKESFSKIKKKVIVAVLVVVFLWSFFAFTRFIFRKVIQSFKRPPKEASRQVQPKLSPIAPTAVVRTQGIGVSLTAKKRCFIRTVVDGKLLFEGILDRNVVESWEADEEIEFRISDGSAVHLEVNGKALPPLSSIRKPIKSLKITPSGITIDK